jgi:hypothetical protein
LEDFAVLSFTSTPVVQSLFLEETLSLMMEVHSISWINQLFMKKSTYKLCRSNTVIKGSNFIAQSDYTQISSCLKMEFEFLEIAANKSESHALVRKQYQKDN